jgi:hypothetical protein
MHTAPGDEAFLSAALFAGFLHRVAWLFPYPFTGPVVPILLISDLLALMGIGAALAWALYRAFSRALTPVTVAIWLFAILTITLSSADAWAEVYAFGRTLTPLALLSVLDGLAIGSVVPVYIMLAIDPRIGLQFGEQILNVLRGVF